jgi:hypothetical protein
VPITEVSASGKFSAIGWGIINPIADLPLGKASLTSSIDHREDAIVIVEVFNQTTQTIEWRCFPGDGTADAGNAGDRCHPARNWAGAC